MRLPQNLLTNTYTKPRIFLCEADKSKICQLETTNTSGAFKFNAYSELSFEVSRVYNDLITGENRVHPYYDKIEALRLIYLDGFGYFEIQTPDLTSDGIKESKTVKAYSSEYTLTQKYLEKFYINTGEIDSVEVLYAASEYGEATKETVEPVTFYNTDPKKKGLSLLNLVVDSIYGWTIGHVDASLMTLSRTFEIDRQSVYDFLMNDLCEQFNCYVIFDTEDNTVNFYAEALTQKFMADKDHTSFTLKPAFDTLGTVTVGGFKNTEYDYNSNTGVLSLRKAPTTKVIVEVTDGSLSYWDTDVFVTFDNLSQEINISYDADDIKTKLTVYGADELDIREVNMGQPYIVDLSYYCTPDWLGQDLYEAYSNYILDYNSKENEYTTNAQYINDISQEILQLENRLSSSDECIMEYKAQVKEDTYGTYYIKHGTPPNYYYTEVSLPNEYKADQAYYQFKTTGTYLTDTKISNLHTAFQEYFQAYFKEKTTKLTKMRALESDFDFKNDAVDMAGAFDAMLTELQNIDDAQYFSPSEMPSPDSNSFPFKNVNAFLSLMWHELGSYPLELLYKPTYVQLQTVAVEQSWGDVSSDDYGKYFAAYLMVTSINKALKIRKDEIADKKGLYQSNGNKGLQYYIDANAALTQELDLYTYFTSRSAYQDHADQYMMRLSAFFREDEYTDDNFVYTGYESTEELYQLKRELKECGKIELSKLCQPRLQFSMSMANIYALPEFEPIIHQFQLGRVIKVALRSDYIKQSRLLQVNINFDDFSDFSCEFGELTNLKTQSDLHADLLSQAISAGKSVASNKSHWDKGSDMANEIDRRIQRGLLDAVTSIKSMDGTQGVEIDNYGIRLRKIDPETGEVDLEEGWITNNKFLYSDDGFQTVQSVYGKFTIDDVDYFGVLAKAVIAGYIEGSKIVGGDMRGGTIKIGQLDDGSWTFEVDEDGTVRMCGGDVVFESSGHNSLKDTIDKMDQGVQEIIKEIDEINGSKMYRVEISTKDSQILKKSDQTAELSCKIYSWDREITNVYLTADGYPDTEEYEFSGKKYIDYARWKRKSNNNTADTAWNNDSAHKGQQQITITPADVAHNASFYCEVNIPAKPVITPTPEPEDDTNKTT